jgi:transcription-repair coupling factor (superfamily II helicase)
MQEIGFNLYTSMLDAAVRSLKAGKMPDLQHLLEVTTEINLHVPALLPEDYCNDVHERLVLYKRMAHCITDEQLQDMRGELIDRFGLLPPPVSALLDCHRLRIAAKALGIARVEAGAESIQLQFIPDPPVNADKIVALIQRCSECALSGPNRLKINVCIAETKERVARIKQIFAELGA